MPRYLIIFFIVFYPLCSKSQNNIWQLITQGKYDDALILTDKQLETDDANYSLYLAKAKILENKFDYANGIIALEKANELQPENTEVLSALAALYRTAGQITKSIELYDKLTVIEPNNAQWKTLCGISLQAAGRYKEAISEYNAARMIDTINCLIYKNMGDCYVRLDELKFAATCYKKAFECNPQNVLLAGQLAGVYIKLNRLQSAIRVSKAALTQDSTFREAYRWLGIAYYQALHRDSSLQVFKHLWNIGDTSTMVNRYLGLLYYQNAGNVHPLNLHEEYTKAEVHLRKAIVADPENIDLLYTLASTCGHNYNPKEGLIWLDSLDKVLSKYEVMKAYTEAERGKLYRSDKKFDKSTQHYRKALQLLPDRYIYIYEIASNYDLAGNKKQALEWFKRFIAKRDPNWEKRTVTNEATLENAVLRRIRELQDELFLKDEL